MQLRSTMSMLMFALSAAIAVAGLPSSGLAAPMLTALYEPSNGNITMQALSGTAPASLSIASFQFLSPALRLSGAAASIPTPAVSFFTVLNTSVSTMVNPPSAAAEIYATNLGGSTPLFTGSWNLGNVAAVGLTQSQINAGFTTDPEVSPGGLAVAGHFLYQIQGSPDFYAGSITAVPEPSTAPLLAMAGLAAWLFGRRAVVKWPF